MYTNPRLPTCSAPLSPPRRPSPSARRAEKGGVPWERALRMLCLKLGSHAPAGVSQVLAEMSWLSTSHMEVEPGEVGDEPEGAPTPQCFASASRAPFPFFLRPLHSVTARVSLSGCDGNMAAGDVVHGGAA